MLVGDDDVNEGNCGGKVDPGRHSANGAGLNYADIEKKLIEEVKLYWFIQLGTATALGALLSAWPQVEAAASHDATIAKLVVLSIGFILLSIGGMYNVVGNYYTFRCNIDLGRDEQQDSVCTPFIASAHGVVCFLLGAGIAIVAFDGVILPVTRIADPAANDRRLTSGASAVGQSALVTKSSVVRSAELLFAIVGGCAGWSLYGVSTYRALRQLLGPLWDSTRQSQVAAQHVLNLYESYSRPLQGVFVVQAGRWLVGAWSSWSGNVRSWARVGR